MAIEIVDFPIKIVIFHSFLLNYQRVTFMKMLGYHSNESEKWNR